MVIGISTFSLKKGMSREQIEALFQVNMQNWENCADLLSKQYFISTDGTQAGGIYRWKTLDDGKKWLGEKYQRLIQDIYGSTPSIHFYFESFKVEANI